MTRVTMLSLAAVGITSASAESSPLEVRVVVLTVEHQPDGKKYPNYVKETYTLEASGVLHYAAYFGGMPIDMNHNDTVDWLGGKRVIELAARLAPKLKVLPDSAPEPGPGIYVVGVTQNDADSTRIIDDPKSKDWKALDAAFKSMLADFEKATKRPLRPDQLPQAPPPAR